MFDHGPDCADNLFEHQRRDDAETLTLALKNLPLDYLKIDGSFIRNLARDTVNQAMVTAMIKLARTLNFKVIAEQVEDSAALEAARRMGVDYLQGYAIGRPQPLQFAAAA